VNSSELISPVISGFSAPRHMQNFSYILKTVLSEVENWHNHIFVTIEIHAEELYIF
jgi:hypothetical protein